MSNTSYHLAIDLGATSGRAVLASFDGEAIATEEIARFKYPMMPLSGHLFWNLPRIYEEVLRSMKRAAEIAAERNMSLSSIGIDSWGCDVAYFYNDGAIAGLPTAIATPIPPELPKNSVRCSAKTVSTVRPAYS